MYEREQNTQIDITGLRKEAVLAALYNAASPCSMGAIENLNFKEEYTRDTAKKDLMVSTHFDYLHGKRMKLNLSLNIIDVRRYNDGSDCRGLGQRIIANLKTDKSAYDTFKCEFWSAYIFFGCACSLLFGFCVFF